MITRAAMLAGVLLFGACSSGSSKLLVDVKTDFTPGVEFNVVVVRLGADETRSPAAIGDDFARGQRVAELDIGSGTHELVTELLALDGSVLASRTTRITFDGGGGVTVVIARSCARTTCPADDPALTACAGGVCVDPRCSPESSEFCRSECALASDCNPAAACGSVRCDDGICLYDADHSACAAMQRCDPEAGCYELCTDPGGCAMRFFDPGMQMITAPGNCTRAVIKVWGAGGGHGEGNELGAAGGFAQAEVDLLPGEPLVLVVGRAGVSAALGGGAGNPGGGRGGMTPGCGGGGGYSGVFRGVLRADRALVIGGAGGGGGSGGGSTAAAGAGGGEMGEPGSGGEGGGGTQTMGGLGNLNGASLRGGDSAIGGGGGAGWYGGGGGSSSDGGGGGSGRANGDNPVLMTGEGMVPGNVGDPDRGSAGDPAATGAVLITCM